MTCFSFSHLRNSTLEILFPQPDEPYIAPCKRAGLDLITAVWSTLRRIHVVMEVNNVPQPVLGRVASLKKKRKKTHNAVLIGA